MKGAPKSALASNFFLTLPYFCFAHFLFSSSLYSCGVFPSVRFIAYAEFRSYCRILANIAFFCS